MLGSLIIMLLLIGADQLTKYLATVHLAPVGTMPFIPGILELKYILNDGAAFSMFADQKWGRTFLVAMTGAVLLAAAIYFFWKKPAFWLTRGAFILILSGGIGNLIDRIANGCVVDFFATTFMDFPVFNVADCYVCIGAVLLVLAVILEDGKTKKKQASENENA